MEPSTLQHKPEIPYYLIPYVSAFWVLSSRRQGGFGPAPIPLSDIHDYLRLFPWYDVDEFVRLILTMDISYLEIMDGRR